MPCSDGPTFEHDVRQNEFVEAALCHAASKLSSEDLRSFPGLAEWKHRHDAIDKHSKLEDRWRAAERYDRRSPYAPKEYMVQYIKAFPWPKGKVVPGVIRFDELARYNI